GRRGVDRRLVERGDARPVGLCRGARPRMAGGDGGLQRIRAARAAELLRAVQGCETALDEQLIPERPILIEKEDGFARRADSRPQARRLDLHQRSEAVDFRLPGEETGEDATEPERILAELGSRPVVAG